MLVLLAILTGGYLAAVVWIVRAKRRSGGVDLVGTEGADLPADDLPPAAAVGWPPGGRQFLTYVDEGYRALDAYLSEGFTA
ncbi:MAG: hypothetical protein ABI807_04955 [Sporichthyaceae bacterium]